MELIVNRVAKTDRTDRQEYLFGEGSKYIYKNEEDPSKLQISYEGRLLSFMIADTYHVSIYADDREKFPIKNKIS